MLKGSLVKLITTNAGTYNAMVHSVKDAWLTVTDEYGNTIDVEWDKIAEFSKIEEESDDFKDFVCHQRVNQVNNKMCELADHVIAKINECIKLNPDLDVESALSMLDDFVESRMADRAN